MPAVLPLAEALLSHIFACGFGYASHCWLDAVFVIPHSRRQPASPAAVPGSNLDGKGRPEGSTRRNG